MLIFIFKCAKKKYCLWSYKKNMNIGNDIDLIELRKKMGTIQKQARARAKLNKCYICGEKGGFCNSHSVPRMCLKEIANEGKVLSANSLIELEVLDIEKGVNNSGTFSIICEKCDATLFRDYESFEALKKQPSDKMMAEIAIKDTLLQISKRLIERELYSELNKNVGIINLGEMENIHEHDLRDYRSELTNYIEDVNKNTDGSYQVLVCEHLPYKVPIAVQSSIALYKDLDGRIVNDVFSMEKEKVIYDMHLCVFPLKRKSLVLLFYHKKNKKYRKLRNQLNSLSIEGKLQYVNYLIFAYTENYFLHESVKGIIKNDENIKKLSKETYGCIPDFGLMESYQFFSGKKFNPVDKGEITNLLLPQYALSDRDV